MTSEAGRPFWGVPPSGTAQPGGAPGVQSGRQDSWRIEGFAPGGCPATDRMGTSRGAATASRRGSDAIGAAGAAGPVSQPQGREVQGRSEPPLDGAVGQSAGRSGDPSRRDSEGASAGNEAGLPPFPPSGAEEDPASAGRPGEDEAELAPGLSLAADLARLVREARRLWGRPPAGVEAEVGRRLALLRQREKSISDCLIVVMLGGTKVGKTTLVNALAGREIGESSARACYTKRPAVFVHQRREGLARTRLAGLLRDDDIFVVHAEPALERIILVDTPDLDGIELEHREVFRKVLERADLALAVVTTQKYDSQILYEILGREMGFRRVVFVFNRIDEGIPFSEKIRQDLLAKVTPLGLRPPEGETLPLFTVSARNALLQKMGGAASGPTGQFAALEALLRERLDQALVRRISEENVAAMRRETADHVATVCRLAAARELAAGLTAWAEERVGECQADLERAMGKAFRGLTPEIIRRREAFAAEGLGGPFGVYVRLTLAVNALAGRFQMFLSGAGGDLEGVMAQRLLEDLQPVVDEHRRRFRRALAERADRADLDAGPLLARLGDCESLAPAVRGHIQEQIGEFVCAPKASAGEAFLLNLGPLVIILLLLRYFVWSLLAAQEPGAGMFLGGAILMWVVCHVQASFWLKRKGGSLEPAIRTIADLFAGEVRRRLVEPVRGWADEVGKIPPAVPPAGEGPAA